MRVRLSLEDGAAVPALLELRPRNRSRWARPRQHHRSQRQVRLEAARRNLPQSGPLVRPRPPLAQRRRGQRRRVRGEAELPPGARLVLGDVCFRFAVETGMEGTDEFPAVGAREELPPAAEAPAGDDETVLHPDELTPCTNSYPIRCGKRGRTASSVWPSPRSCGRRGPTWWVPQPGRRRFAGRPARTGAGGRPLEQPDDAKSAPDGRTVRLADPPTT